MAASYNNYGISSSSWMKCEIKVVGAKNINTKQKGNLFIRCYLSGGSNTSRRRIQINTKEISSSSSSQEDEYIFWDESFSLECNGTRDSIQSLGEESVFFELRWRNKNPFIGKIGGSQVVATAEMPWKNVFGAAKMELQRWVVMSVVNDEDSKKLMKVEDDGVKAPALQIAMKVEVPAMSVEEMRKMRRRERLDECGCNSASGCGNCSSSTCVHNELLFIGATLDGF